MVKFKSGNEKPACYFLFLGNSNVCPICHCLLDMVSGIVDDLDLYSGSMLNINKPMERSYAVSVTIREIVSVAMCMTLALMSQSQS